MLPVTAPDASPRSTRPSPAAPVAVLDDDPTGTQEVENTPVVLDWSPEVLRTLPQRSFHVVTNTRAHPAAAAYSLTHDAAAAVVDRFADALVVLRGDSTLRAHLREEYEAIRDVVFPGATPTLLLVPALPAAGRITIGGVHLLESGGRRLPLNETAYAADGDFSYRSARLLDWAEERSYGLFAAARGTGAALADLRTRGGAAVHEALSTAAAAGGPAVCAPDAETVEDLEAIVDGLRSAQADGVLVIVRSAPTFAALLGGGLARTLQPIPHASSLLIVCGSYVQRTTQQLARFRAAYPDAVIEIALEPLLSDGREAEINRVAAAARISLSRLGVAAVTTPRERTYVADDLAAAEKVAASLAALAAILADEVSLVLFKGGITSAVGIRDGLEARVATIEGPVAPGIALWRLQDGRQCIVFPGNVGDDGTLTRLVTDILS